MAAEPVSTSAEFVLTNAPGWLAYLFVILAVVLGWWAWRRYGPAPGGAAGWIARACRVSALVLVVALLAGPALRQTRVTTEAGTIVVAIDASASMARADGPDGAFRIDAAWALRERLEALAAQRPLRVEWYQVGDGLEPIDPAQLDQVVPTGSRSALGEDLAQLAFQTRPGALILVSDGRVTAGSSLAATGDRLARHDLPAGGVWALGVGGGTIDPELRLDELVVPRQAPLGERVPVRLRLSGRQLGEQAIRIVIRRGEEIVAEELVEPPTPGEDTDELSDVAIDHTLEVVFPDEGEHRLTVEVFQQDLRASGSAAVQVQERDLQVLMLAHRPRYEMRYLRVALERDRTVTVHSYLADGRWRRWGDSNYGPRADVPPLEPAELLDYDAIIIGDVGAQAFRNDQLETIANHVRDRGAGLVWVPGSRGAITSYRGTRLGNLLPVRLGDSVGVARGYLDNVERRLEPTQRAQALNLLVLDRQEWGELPLLRTGAPVVEVVPGAEVLAVDARAGDAPLVVVRDYDAGRALFVGTDDTWRWRREVGDRYLHRFWSQLLRYTTAARGQGDQRWRAIATPPVTTPGEPVQLGIVPNGAVGDLDSLPRDATLRLDPGATAEEQLHRLHRPSDQRSFLATVPAPPPGTWTVTAAEGFGSEAVIPAELVVLPPRDELRDPRIDVEALRDLTSATGGKLILASAAAAAGADPAEALVSQLPTLSHQQPSTRTEDIWDEWWALILLCALLCTEWALRRWFRLP